MNEAIRDYLDGRSETGLLLKGRKGLPMMEDAIKGSSVLLGCKEEQVRNHPDFLLISSSDKNILTVDDALSIITKAESKPGISDKTVVLIDGMDCFNIAAQNKLLKLIEDGSIIVIGIAYDDLIATIESRMVIVNYNPLTKSEFRSVCADKGIDDPDMLYYITEGVQTEVKENLLQVFKSVKDDVMSEQPEDLLSSLHLVKEKDDKSFFAVHSDHINQLFSYLSYLSSLMLQAGRIDNDKFDKLLLSISDNRRRCGQSNYTKDDFFIGIVSFIEALKS